MQARSQAAPRPRALCALHLERRHLVAAIPSRRNPTSARNPITPNAAWLIALWRAARPLRGRKRFALITSRRATSSQPERCAQPHHPLEAQLIVVRARNPLYRCATSSQPDRCARPHNLSRSLARRVRCADDIKDASPTMPTYHLNAAPPLRATP